MATIQTINNHAIYVRIYPNPNRKTAKIAFPLGARRDGGGDCHLFHHGIIHPRDRDWWGVFYVGVGVVEIHFGLL